MTFRVTTWNVENFTTASPAYADKLEFLRDTLVDIDPDVVALQEVLDPAALTALGDELGYATAAADPDGRGNRVAFLFRSAPVAVQPIPAWRLAPNVVVQELDGEGQVATSPQFSRPALQATVVHGRKEIVLVNAHLKSKLLTFPGGYFSTANETLRANAAYLALQRRAAESTTLREHATDLLAKGQHVIVLGDFNDGPDAATTQILYGPGGGQPKGPDEAMREHCAFQRSDDDDGRRLFNITKLVPPELRWSRKHDGQKELLDHILASQGLMPRVGLLRRLPAIEIRNADAPEVGQRPRVDGVVPDHAPVTATFHV